MRAYDLALAKGNEAAYLFSDGVSAGDLCQGGLGDCWLISAIAALAEYPGLIQRIFLTKETSPLGRYSLRLFDITEEGGKGKFVNVTVDDRLPCKCDGGFPKLMYLSMDDSGEIWPLLVEKALAKWAGSYENLDGGHCAWALATLTGWETESYVKFGKDNHFTKCKLEPDKEDPRNPHSISFKSTRDTLEADELFKLLQESDSKDYVMTCATNSGKDTVEESAQGIVQGHAYTLIGAFEVGKHRLVQLRNPWGR
jgi:calpain-15